MRILDLSLSLDYLDKIHQRTMRVAHCIPPDKLDWTWGAGRGSRTGSGVQRSFAPLRMTFGICGELGGWRSSGSGHLGHLEYCF